MYRPWRYPIPSVTPDTSSVLALGREGFPGLLLGESQGGQVILAELTTTPHVGIHRYTYKKGIESTLVVDMDHLLDNEYIYEGWVKQTGENELTGMRRTRGWVDNQYVFFVAQFSQPFSSMEQPSGTASRTYLRYDYRKAHRLQSRGIDRK